MAEPERPGARAEARANGDTPGTTPGAKDPPPKKPKSPNRKGIKLATLEERAARANAKGIVTDETAHRNTAKARPDKTKVPGQPWRSAGGATSDAELLYRLRVVEQAIIDGKRGAQIQEELKNHGRTVPYTTVMGYTRKVRDKWSHEDSLLRPIWRERQMRKLHDVAAILEAGGHWGHWVAVQKLIADLEGNLAPVKVEHKQVDQFEGWTVEELERYVESGGQFRPSRVAQESGGVGEGGMEWTPPTHQGSGSVH